jgi:hypothetical protein
MNVEANKTLVRFYEEVWARGNVAFTGEVFTDDYVRQDLRPMKVPVLLVWTTSTVCAVSVIGRLQPDSGALGRAGSARG